MVPGPSSPVLSLSFLVYVDLDETSDKSCPDFHSVDPIPLLHDDLYLRECVSGFYRNWECLSTQAS